MSSLDVLIDDGIIDLTLKRLKSGKEADVYLVDRGEHVLVAKVYKDKATRSFKNNADYKEGRKVRNSRTQRAMNSRSKFGREASENDWKTTEADTLRRLYASGVRVPEPVMFYQGVLLMHLVMGADGCPAPRLIDLEYDSATAKAHYLDLRGQMIRMLCIDLIHGDLSPYNILAAEAGPTIIDFPQIISAAHTQRASSFFLRDFDNVLEFLIRADPTLRAHAGDGRKIWHTYQRRHLTPDFVPSTQSPSERGRNREESPRNRAGRQARKDQPSGTTQDSKNTRRRTRGAAQRSAQPPGRTETRARGENQSPSPARSSKPASGTSTGSDRPRRRRRRRP